MNAACATAILDRDYGDVLRAGALHVNDTTVTWEHGGHQESALIDFFTAMANCPALPSNWIAYLDQFIYCIAKALSANFMLYKVREELMSAFQLPAPPTLPSDGLSYHLSIKDGKCTAAIAFPPKSKVFYMLPPDPDAPEVEDGKKEYVANIDRIYTTFAFPLPPAAKQEYRVEMRVSKSYFMRFKTKTRKQEALTTDQPLLAPLPPVSPSHTRSYCPFGCGRATGRGLSECCETCRLSEGRSHGQRCSANREYRLKELLSGAVCPRSEGPRLGGGAESLSPPSAASMDAEDVELLFDLDVDSLAEG